MQDYDDVDLRPYMLAVARRWYWVVIGALLVAVIVAGVSMSLPKTYTATSSVLLFIRQTGSQVGVNEPIVRIETIDITARRQGLLALAQSDAIEAQIQPDVLKQLVPGGYQPGTLTRYISVRADGDLLKISASAASPEQARALADAWATTYVNYVKALYTDQHSEVQLAGRALTPLGPSSPQTTLNTLVGGVAGALIGIVLALLIDVMRTPAPAARRRIKSESPARSAAS
ncbi:MAG TPA: hypothetical protein VFZ66_08015 [Herpetosiphonaceae bacterium]